ncbi:glycosyltransferase family A protein [Terrabacter sp. NPDC000476]|uniref:glycosyltransferase family 2 protein n=1 Tax=Terrabacter sp. NPDC000476 TaxID=3154258 RepID=UPI00332ECBBF
MRISVVVPTRNSARTLRACLTSLRHQTHPDVEVVVVDNASTDGTAEIARELADTAVDRGPERSAQRNHGAALSTGEVVLFVDSDMVLEPGVVAEVEALLERRPDVGSVVVPERSFGEGFFTECRVLEKSLYVGADDVEAPRAFRREVLDLVGGWSEHLTAAEDWDLADRCAAAGVVVGRVDAWIWHDEGRIRLRGTFSKKRYYGRWIAHYLGEHRAEGGRRLAHTSLFRQPGRLLADPVHAGGMLLLKSVEASGLAAGMLDARRETVKVGS